MIQVKKNNDIEVSGFILKKNGIEISGAPTFTQWEKVGEFIKRSDEAVQFWRGDWLNYGENTYKDWKKYFGDDSVAYQTLANEKWVSKKIPVDRRRVELSWSHHAEVADLEPEEQEEMLEVAQTQKLPISVFRKTVRHYKLKLDVPELDEKSLESTDPVVFAGVQEIIDSSLRTIELMEKIDLSVVNVDARDWLLSHLKRATGFYLGILKRYDKQK